MLPILEAGITPEIDGYASSRLAEMTDRYADYIARARARAERLRDG